FTANDPDNASISLGGTFASAFAGDTVNDGSQTILHPTAQASSVLTGALQVTDGAASASVLGSLTLGTNNGDTIAANTSANITYGFGGDDTFNAAQQSSGAESIFGGAGNDTFIVTNTNQIQTADLFDGGADTDKIQI